MAPKLLLAFPYLLILVCQGKSQAHQDHQAQAPATQTDNLINGQLTDQPASILISGKSSQKPLCDA